MTCYYFHERGQSGPYRGYVLTSLPASFDHPKSSYCTVARTEILHDWTGLVCLIDVKVISVGYIFRSWLLSDSRFADLHQRRFIYPQRLVLCLGKPSNSSSASTYVRAFYFIFGEHSTITQHKVWILHDKTSIQKIERLCFFFFSGIFCNCLKNLFDPCSLKIASLMSSSHDRSSQNSDESGILIYGEVGRTRSTWLGSNRFKRIYTSVSRVLRTPRFRSNLSFREWQPACSFFCTKMRVIHRTVL